MTYIGEPAEINYTFDPTEPFVTEGNQVAYGPLIYSEYQGWDTGVQVQNLSGVGERQGQGLLPATAPATSSPPWWTGSARAAARPSSCRWSTTCPATGSAACASRARNGSRRAARAVQPPNIVGVVTLDQVQRRRRAPRRARRSPTTCCPSTRPTTGSSARPAAAPRSGIGLIAIPSLLKDLDGTGIDHRAGDRQPRAQARLHRLRHLHLRPERPARLRLREAERPPGRVHRPPDLGLREPGLQGQRHHQRHLLGARRLRRRRRLPAQPRGPRRGRRGAHGGRSARTCRATSRRPTKASRSSARSCSR